MESAQPLPVAQQWRGIHHIALATPDLDATIAFYQGVLGMQVSDIAPSRAGRGRHCLVFAKPDDPDTWGLHYFERGTAGSPVQPAARESSASAAGPMLHIAFRLVDDDAANALRERLRIANVAITEIAELGSFVFSDNNGIMLEATWPKA